MSLCKFNLKFLLKKLSPAMSLVEAAIAVALVGLVTFPLVSITGGFLERAKLDKTNKSVAIIKEALTAYYLMNKALPCPANPSLSPSSASYGSSVANCQSFGAIVAGAVPVDALGLSRDFILDGYGRKFNYSLATAFAVSGGVSYYRDQATKQVIADNGIGTQVAGSSFIQVNSSSGSLLTNDNLFVINSYGKDGLSAYNENGTRISLASVNTPSGSGVVTFTDPYVFYAKSETGGDDILQYTSLKSISPLLQDYGYIDCSAINGTAGDMSSLYSYTFPRSKANTSVVPTSVQSCSSKGAVLLQNASASCSNSGEWINFSPQQCGFPSKSIIYASLKIGDIGSTNSSLPVPASLTSATKTIDAGTGMTLITINTPDLGTSDYNVFVTLSSPNATDAGTVTTPVVRIVSSNQFQVLIKDLASAVQSTDFAINLIISTSVNI